MAVLITAEVPGQTKEGYDGMLSVLEGPIKATPGFILHAAYESVGNGAAGARRAGGAVSDNRGRRVAPTRSKATDLTRRATAPYVSADE
jgi:hypothetical protein